MDKTLGLSQAHYSFIEKALKEFLSNKNEYKVYVFGSRAVEKNRKYSDLDLLIDSKPNLTKEEVENLRIQMEESDLPIKIDLVTTCDILAPYQERIEAEKKLWFKS